MMSFVFDTQRGRVRVPVAERAGWGLPALLAVVFALTMMASLSSSPGATFSSQLITNLTIAGGAPAASDPSEGVAMGGYFYFAASDGTNGTTGRELWRTDGTAAGTTLVKDIYPGPASSSPEQLVASGTNVFFLANDGVHGKELWRTDGTGTGTVMVADMVTVTTGGVYRYLALLGAAPGNGVYFSLQTNVTDWPDVFRGDATPSVIRLTGPGGIVSTNHVVSWTVSSAGDIFFATQDAYSLFSGETNTIWRFAGAGPFFDYGFQTVPQRVALAGIVGTNCYFVVNTNWTQITPGATNHYYWQKLMRTSTGVIGGAIQQADNSAITTSGESVLSGFTVLNNHLFYYLQDASFLGSVLGPGRAVGESGAPVQFETGDWSDLYFVGQMGSSVYYVLNPGAPAHIVLKRTDGASAGVQAVDFTAAGLSPQDFVAAGNRFFFYDYSSALLGVTDTTQGGTFTVANSTTNAAGYSRICGALGNRVVFDYDDTHTGLEPWISDGTTVGTKLIADLASGVNTPPPLEALVSSGLLFFTVPGAGTNTELWRSDGTAPGTIRLKPDLWPNPALYPPNQLTVANGMLFFTTGDPASGVELWRSDGTVGGTSMVKDVRPGPASSNPSQLTGAGNQLFFVADDGTHGAELWRSDGTDAGTQLVQDIVPGSGAANIRNLGATGNRVHFLAGPNANSGQFWYSDGPGNTQLLLDFGTISYGARPAYVTYSNRVYFTMYGTYGPILWTTDDTPSGTIAFANNLGYENAVAGPVLYSTPGLYRNTADNSGMVLLSNVSAAQLTPVGSNLYFTQGLNLWTTDGTTNATVPVTQLSVSNAPLNSPPPDEAIGNLTSFKGALVFSTWTPLLGSELWATAPGQPAQIIEDLSPGSGDANVLFVRAGTNQVFYLARPSGQAFWQLRSLHLQSVAPPPEAPYGGTPWPVPGLIEAENFDVGGEGVAYHDSTSDNEGAVYRLEGVDIQPCNDTGGGYCVFQTRAGEWLNYTIQAAVDGLYQLDVRMTSQAVDTGYFYFELDGNVIADQASLNNGTPGGWYTESTTVAIPAGRHVLRLYLQSNTSAGDVGVFNWFNFTLLQTNQPPLVTITSPPEGGIYSSLIQVPLSASVNDVTSGTQPTAEFFVDGLSVGVVSNAPYSLSWTPTSPGPHTVSATATDSFGLAGSSSNTLFFVAEPLLPNASFWRANVFGTNLLSSWKNTTFNDSTWPRARAAFGFGYSGLHSIIPSNINNVPIPTWYFRQSFSNNLSTFNYASLTLTRDDAAVVYINGQTLARVNLPQAPAPVTFTNLALTNVVNNTTTRTNAAVDVIPVPLSMLVDGTNVIAVEIHQGLPGRDLFDMKFDLSFSTVSYTPPPTLSSTWSNATLLVQWADTLAGWTLEQSTDLTTWSTATGTINDTGGLFTLALNPPFLQRQFFRLHKAGP